MSTELFYLQDKRSYVGNDILFWAKEGRGYTTDIRKAETFTKDEAQKMNQSRETDIPWPKDYIDSRTRPAVDMQYVNINDALLDTGIKLREPAKPKKETYHCFECGGFISIDTYYGGTCKRCGTRQLA